MPIDYSVYVHEFHELRDKVEKHAVKKLHSNFDDNDYRKQLAYQQVDYRLKKNRLNHLVKLLQKQNRKIT